MNLSFEEQLEDALGEDALDLCQPVQDEQLGVCQDGFDPIPELGIAPDSVQKNVGIDHLEFWIIRRAHALIRSQQARDATNL